MLIIKKIFSEIRTFMERVFTEGINFISFTANIILLHWRRASLWFLISQLKPIHSKDKKNNVVEVMSLVSHNDTLSYLCMIKTFSYFSKRIFPITVCDDGTLTKNDISILKKNVRGIKIISNKIANVVVQKKLRTYPYSSELRKKIVYMRKKIDFPLLARKERVLILDSDLLFFKKPTEILKWMNNRAKKTTIFISDCRDSYILSNIETSVLFKTKMISRLNSGIIGFHRQIMSLKKIEAFSKFILNGAGILTTRYPQIQAIFAFLFAQLSKQHVHRLPKTYLLSEARCFIPNLVCRHYVRSVRELFYHDALYVLNEIKKKSLSN